jgi:hypothetical protein
MLSVLTSHLRREKKTIHARTTRRPRIPSVFNRGTLPSSLLFIFRIALIVFFATGNIQARNLADFRGEKELTPDSLIRQFADFTFELGETIQEPEQFLQRKRGDCDDFARLVALLLAERGYKPRIVAVAMEGETHVVCYVPEVKGFLDFNHRAAAQPVTQCAGTLESIAELVSAEFRTKWRMVSEIRFENAKRVFVETVLYYPQPVAQSPAPAAVAALPQNQ